ncbi:RILP -like protein [Brachionus plicatilis]|uniref:RILP-like protein n=1 Tax=Brachionus plicatilis TaxID=10195 RepID=A0A3M7R382_BRAPC|nr:RILP -like protein [Brachionus plicatilis]
MTSSPVLGNGFYASKHNMVRRDSYNQFTPSEINNYEYTLSDVYDDAAIIGSELEKIINNFGSEILKDLMPKVISVLELLESMTINKEKENDQINELKMRINSLEMEKTARNNEREKFEKELEEIDEKWKQETYKLITMINKLKDENKRLNEYLDQNKSIESKQSELLVIKQEELDYIRQIKEENYRLKETIRLKDREIEQKNSDHEGLLGQIERLNSTLLSLRRKQILAQNQIEKMVKSKAEIECTLTEKEHQLNLIRERLKTKNLTEIIDKKEPPDTIDKEAMSSQEKLSKDITNLLIFDANDPNRPRFTLRELQKVLREKNELTIKLDQTQDELEQLKCQDNLGGEVQGPINREPEEKLDPTAKQSQSGIRRFFSFFLNSLNNTISTDESNSNEQTASNVTTNVFVA